MSTRSTTHFKQYGEVQANIFRHTDGYPSVAGTRLAQFLEECAALRDSRLDDASMLAARYVVFLAQEFAVSSKFEGGEWTETPNESRLDFLSVRVMNGDAGDIEFLYTVDCDNLDSNGFPAVTCEDLQEGCEVPTPQPERRLAA